MHPIFRNKFFLSAICVLAGFSLGFFFAFTRSLQNGFLKLSVLLILSFSAGMLLNRQKRMYVIAFFLGLMILPPAGFFLRPEVWPIWLGEMFFIISGFFTGLYIKKYKLAVAFTSLLLIGGICLQSFVLLPSFFMRRTFKLEEKNNGKSFYDIFPSTGVLQTADGNRFNLNSLKGKIILYDFWFVGCAPCKEKEPSLIAITQKYADNKDVQVVCINTGDANSFRRFKDYKLHKNLLSLYDSAGIFSKTLGVAGMPQEYLVDKDGTIISSFSGFSYDMDYLYEKNTLKQIETLIKK